MRVTRFMCRAEWDRLNRGERIYNDRKHSDSRTTSVGFCFTEDEPKVAWEYLGGEVDADVCAVFDFPEGYLTESTAEYADQREGVKMTDLMTKREWCCDTYSLEDVKVVKVIDPYRGEDYRQLKRVVDFLCASGMTLDDLENIKL